MFLAQVETKQSHLVTKANTFSAVWQMKQKAQIGEVYDRDLALIYSLQVSCYSLSNFSKEFFSLSTQQRIPWVYNGSIYCDRWSINMAAFTPAEFLVP